MPYPLESDRNSPQGEQKVLKLPTVQREIKIKDIEDELKPKDSGLGLDTDSLLNPPKAPILDSKLGQQHSSFSIEEHTLHSENPGIRLG